MNEKTKQALVTFSSNDTWHTTHGSDTERFNEFIITAFESGDTHLSSEYMMEIIKPGTPELEDVVKKLHTRYEDGIELLGQFNVGE